MHTYARQLPQESRSTNRLNCTAGFDDVSDAALILVGTSTSAKGDDQRTVASPEKEAQQRPAAVRAQLMQFSQGYS